MMKPVAEAALEVIAAGTDFPGLRRALFAAVARRHLKTGTATVQVGVTEDECRLPLEVLLERLPTRPMATVATINKGRTGIKDALPGPYPLVVTAEERGSSDHFDFEGPGVMIPMVSSTGHGDASLKRVHFQDGQYAVGSILSVVQPRDPEQLSARYLHVYLSSFKDELLVSRMVGTANVSLTVAKIGDVPVPLLPIDAQRKVDELMALCDRLEARQHDAEAAHARLVHALLDSFTQARDAAEFQACWQKLTGQFDVLFTTNSSLEQLSHVVLSLAISGRLTDQSSSDEPAHLLQMHLETDAKAFCEANNAPRVKLDPIRAEDELFAPPEGWIWARLGSLFRVITDGDHQAPPQTSDGIAFLTIGNVTDGFLNFEQCRSVEETYFSGLATYRKPAIGDLLYTVVGATYGRPVLVDSDRPFCVQRHIAILKRSEHLNAKFALYLLRSQLVYGQASASTTGTAQPTIPLKPLRNMLVPLPPLAEQRRIVAKVDELLVLCDQLKARIAAARAKQAQLAEALVAQVVAA